MTRSSTLCARTVAAAFGLLVLLPNPGHATLIDAGSFSGNDCMGAGGFASCRATITGSQNGATVGSPVIYKTGPDGSDLGSFTSITGSEFTLNFDSTTDILSWTYTPGPGDPDIHYFTIKQGNTYELLYDLTNPITSYSANILTAFHYDGISHVSWFDTGGTPGNPVPEPSTISLLGLGLLALAAIRQRRYFNS